ncbi:hypothetical protein GCK32_021271 [Trichostrongylus colubriformis]|uniref:Uncharacterized protein n=1 Tax=Trichostrongylus colubriformis TaxID=6319 RepID=A0AAN8J0J0_TRICO
MSEAIWTAERTSVFRTVIMKRNRSRRHSSLQRQWLADRLSLISYYYYNRVERTMKMLLNAYLGSWTRPKSAFWCVVVLFKFDTGPDPAAKNAVFT